MSEARIRGRWVKDRLVGLAGLDRLGHCVVALKNEAPGAVLAVGGLVLALHDRKRLHHVVDVVACDDVEVEETRVQLRSQHIAAPTVPTEGSPWGAQVCPDCSKVPGGVCQLDNAPLNP